MMNPMRVMYEMSFFIAKNYLFEILKTPMSSAIKASFSSVFFELSLCAAHEFRCHSRIVAFALRRSQSAALICCATSIQYLSSFSIFSIVFISHRVFLMLDRIFALCAGSINMV